MITRATAIKFVVALLISAVLIVYILVSFLGVLNFLRGDYTVRMQLPDASGLFERGEVTYRGLEVGIVDSIRLTLGGVEAELLIEGTAPEIPADLQALILNRSAAGERFVDLRPNTDRAPYLADGSVIPLERTTVPIPVEDVLLNLDQLVSTVPLDDLRTVVSELGAGFSNLGPKLQLLLDSTSSLVDTANDNLPQTLTLIRDARTVLRTQNDLADPIKSFSRDLRLVTEQLRASDPDVRRLTETGPAAGRELSALLDESGDDLGTTIRELRIASQILRERNDGIEQVLVAYPMFTSVVPTVAPNDGTAHLGLILNVNDPPSCAQGYQDAIVRPGVDTAPAKVNFRAFCRQPLGDETGVRAVKANYPFEDGRAQDPAEWFDEFYDGGPRDGINGSDSDGAERSATAQRAGGRPLPSPELPALLGAPDQQGSFGLTPSLLPR